MKWFIVACILIPTSAFGQPALSLNTHYQYDPLAEINLNLRPVRLANEFILFFELKKNRAGAARYSIQWEKRANYSQRNGEVLNPSVTSLDSLGLKGKFLLPIPDKPWLLLAKVRNEETNESWVFFTLIDPKFPVNGYLEDRGQPVLSSYVTLNREYTLQGSGSGKKIFISYYSGKFPASAPAFAVKESRVDRFMFPDSTFSLSSNSIFKISKEGLYLVQEDTSSAEGFSFRGVSTAFPKFTKLAELTDPLIFITTKEEHQQLVQAGEDKGKFDKVILDFTGNKDRAKDFMRNYFKRVELANHYFASYKEGWRTDRGMIFMIFGLPDEVSRNDNNEIWHYKNIQTRFTFVRSGSVYDPANFVLIRDKRFTDRWYSTIDLWRKSRF